MENLPKSRMEARCLGEKHFYTGRPCKQGHYEKRAVSSGSCLACIRDATKSWGERNKDRMAAYTRKHRQKRSSGEHMPDSRFSFTALRVQEKLSEISKGRLRLASDAVVAGHAIKCICQTHGEIELWWNNVLRGKGCPQCSFASRRSNTDKFIEQAKGLHGERWDYSEVKYTRASLKVSIRCLVHGEFLQTPNKHLSGQGCPKCAVNPKWEEAIYNFVRGHNFYALRSAPVLNGKHIDIYVPEIKLGVELHGLRWHTEDKRHKNYHREKWKTSEALGIRLIQVFEDEWANNKEVVLNRIRAALGLVEGFNARQTLLGVVPSQEAAAFFDTYHSQGNTRASVVYGLRLNGEWVAMASFGKARTGAMVAGGNSVWEVIRYASKGRVRGGFSKLFKRFIENYKPEKVISYCDLRYGTGALYKATGFELDGITDPDYWWVPDGKIVRVPRYQTQKHKMPSHPVLKDFYDPTKTEVEICHAAGWYRIYGVGHQRWVWKST